MDRTSNKIPPQAKDMGAFVGKTARFAAVGCIAGLAMIAMWPTSAEAIFIGRPVQASLRGDDGVRITAPFTYIDPKNRKWLVPKGLVSDGASIPRFLWAVLGGPLDGQYRDAAFIHDYYYQVRTRKKADVDRMFYDAMIELRIHPKKAFIMWKAVEWFGRTWRDPQENPICEDPQTPEHFDICSENSAAPSTVEQDDSAQRVDKFIETFRESADENDIRNLVAENEKRKQKR